MTPMTQTTDEVTAKIEALGVTFLAQIQELIADMTPEGEAGCVLAGSIGVQAVIVALAHQREQDALWSACAVCGGAEGIGAVLARIPDAGVRQNLFQNCMRSAAASMHALSTIHDTEGAA